VKLLALLAALIAVNAGDVDQSEFRYVRPLDARGDGPVRFEPDSHMYGHARIGFPDLRILDSEGAQVPWRPEPTPAALAATPVALVARGRREGAVSVVADRGVARSVVDRIELETPDRVFTGRVLVQGSNTGAEGSYATLSTTPIYSVRGAVDARSTTAVFPPTDYRYLLIRASGISDITGARVARDPQRAPLELVQSTSKTTQEGSATVVVLDAGSRRVPIDAVHVASSTPTYVREVRVEGSNDGRTYVPLTGAEIARFPGVDLSTVDVEARHRFVRVTIDNGDDRPLERLRVEAEAAPRPLLLAAGYTPPFRVLYGGPGVSAPTYDFARLPPSATGFEQALDGTLGDEAVNAAFEPRTEATTFFERNEGLVEVLLVGGALVVAAGGALALRRRT
jgi:hypothetical protein